MLSKIKSYLSSYRRSRLEIYAGIDDLILRVWDDIHETGNVTLLIKNKFKLTTSIIDYCSDLWDDIRQEQVDAFGMPQEYKEYWNLKADLAINELKYATTNNAWFLNLIKIAKSELAELEKLPKQDRTDTKSIIEKYWLNGQRIDRNVTTVKEYFSYIKLLERHGQSN